MVHRREFTLTFKNITLKVSHTIFWSNSTTKIKILLQMNHRAAVSLRSLLLLINCYRSLTMSHCHFTGMFFGCYQLSYTKHWYLIHVGLAVYNTLYYKYNVALNNTSLLELPAVFLYSVTIHHRYAL